MGYVIRINAIAFFVIMTKINATKTMPKCPIFRSSYISIIFIILLLMLSDISNATATEQMAGNWLDEPITIGFKNEPLNEIIKKISKQTGVSIAYDQKLANEKVTGRYQDVKTSDAITRLFKGKNISIQVNNEKKIIIVKTFGAKNFIWINTPQNHSIQMTLAEIEEMHAKQFKTYKETIANNNEILEGGMTRGEILAMHKQQNQNFQMKLADESEIIEGGITRGDLVVMHKKQNQEFQKIIENNEEILEGGMTRDEIRAVHKKQKQEFNKDLSNKNIVLEGNITRVELQAMHERQKKQFYKNRNQ